jgi:integration host factor subunit beta
MIKSELVRKLASDHPHLFQRDIETIVSTILSIIADALAQGERVELRGFGTFAVKTRHARQGRNPRSGETVAVPGKIVPAFRPSKEMHQRLNAVGKSLVPKLQQERAPSVRDKSLVESLL